MKTKYQLSEKTDDALIRLFKNGDDRAFAAIIDRYNQKMKTAARKIISDPSLVEDIVQESSIKAFQAIKKDGFTLQNLPAWLARIARNTAINHYRRASRRPADQISSEKVQDIGFKRALADDHTDHVFSTEEQISEMLTAISELDDVYQEVLLLHYIEGYTFDQISKIKDTCSETLRGRSRRALKRVKAACEKK